MRTVEYLPRKPGPQPPTRPVGVWPTLAWLATALLISLPASAAEGDRCLLQISSSTVDYGSVTRAELLLRQVSPLKMALGKQTVTLTANCKQARLMTVFYRGNAADAGSYRLGDGGSFSLRVLSARLDGRTVGVGSVSVVGQVPETRTDSILLAPGIGAVPIVDDVPVKGSLLSLQVEIDASMHTTSSRVADRTVFRGNGNFELLEH
ncbi:hypothetical protein [Herbaspirillum sp. alder98]|uniref:hypothetical protein n=1 Tax=Herbaspirillum sp. alder98 TaxID=2913096 RepID=UPI001CD85F33|nr:hypothetical protein [Herbaspirillum sp. alder98]MCA1322982.1 hypothetical protein [Herbaspirillum sp. alder98]